MRVVSPPLLTSFCRRSRCASPSLSPATTTTPTAAATTTFSPSFASFSSPSWHHSPSLLTSHQRLFHCTTTSSSNANSATPTTPTAASATTTTATTPNTHPGEEEVTVVEGGGDEALVADADLERWDYQNVLVELRNRGLFHTQRAFDACEAVDPADFADDATGIYNPSDISPGSSSPISEAEQQVNGILSFVITLNHLEPALQKGAVALDIGAGSCFFTLLMAHLVGPTGQVIALDNNPEVLKVAQLRVLKLYPHLAPRIRFAVGDGRGGLSDCAPYDCINVGAATEEIAGQWVGEMRVGGLLMVPLIEPPEEGIRFTKPKQFLNLVEKNSDEGDCSSRTLTECNYEVMTSGLTEAADRFNKKDSFEEYVGTDEDLYGLGGDEEE